MKIVGNPLPGMPWEERPAGCKDVLWRYSKNPVIPRDLLPDSNSIFNSAVVPFKGGFAGVFRCDDKNRRMTLHVGFSKDGIKWDIKPETIKFSCDIPEVAEWVYGYDPRVVKIDGRYYVTWCNGYHGPTIGVAWTDDFETFHQVENAFLPYNRNGVMFPKKFNGRFAMLSRPSDTGHTAFGDIFYSESPDLEFWGHHRHVMAPAPFEVSAWQCMKIGAGGERLAVHEDRRRPGAHRDLRRLAPPLSRRPPLLQRLCLCVRQRPPGPRRALEGPRPQRPVPHQPARVL